MMNDGRRKYLHSRCNARPDPILCSVKLLNNFCVESSMIDGDARRSDGIKPMTRAAVDEVLECRRE